MKKIRLFAKKIIIYIIIFMIVISSITPISFAYTQSEVGKAVAGFAKHVVDEYGNPGKKRVGYRRFLGDTNDNAEHIGVPRHTREDNPCWDSSMGWDDYVYFDCSSFATGCYNYVTGLIKEPYVTYTLCYSTPSDMQESFEKITWDKSQSTLRVGDLVVFNTGAEGAGHAWIYTGAGKTSEVGTIPAGANHKQWDQANSISTVYIYRIKEEAAETLTKLNTEFSKTKTGLNGKGMQSSKLNYSNFFFNGVPDGKYSLATRKSIFDIIIDALKDLVNFFIGLISYLFRGFIIGIISVFDRLLNNTIQSLNDTPVSIEKSGVSATDADDPIKMHRYITIEGLIFGEVDLFDVNIFKVD